MKSHSTQKKGKLLLRFLLVNSLMVAALSISTFAQSSNPQMIDVYFKWGDADYLNLSGKNVLAASNGLTQKERNLESWVVGYKAWNLVGDYVYNQQFSV